MMYFIAGTLSLCLSAVFAREFWVFLTQSFDGWREFFWAVVFMWLSLSASLLFLGSAIDLMQMA
jgi:hypothetical protein